MVVSQVGSDKRLKRKRTNKEMQYVEHFEPICKGRQTHIKYEGGRQAWQPQVLASVSRASSEATRHFRQSNNDRVLAQAK